MEPYIGELKIFAFDRIPKAWAACNGALINIKDNPELFSIIGTQYGGDGTRTFALPDLRGRVAMHGNAVGQPGGKPGATLTGDNLPPHSHTIAASTEVVNTSLVTNNLIGVLPTFLFDKASTNVMTMAAPAIGGPDGAGLPVSNMQPYLGLSVCIALKGIRPSKN